MCKHFLLFLIVIPLAIFAQPRSVNQATDFSKPELTEAQRIMQKAKTGKPYDVTRNFLAGDNLYSYVGQELYVLPPMIPYKRLAKITNDQGSYSGFLPPEVTQYASNDMLHFNAYQTGLGNGGTPAKYLARRTFVVDKIRQVVDYPEEFIFFMHDKKTGEHVNFLYNTKGVDHNEVRCSWGFPDFPFLTLSHFKYLQKKYINQPLIVSAHSFSTRDDGWHRLDAVDINTHDSIRFPEADYYMFKVEDIVYDEEFATMCYQLSDGTHSFLSPLEMSYNEPSYANRAARKFLKTDWDKLVSKYGKATMESVLCSEITEQMDTTLLHLTLGQGVTYEYKGIYYTMFCSTDQTVVFDENWHQKGVIVGQCKDIRDKVIATAISVMVTYRVVTITGRIISAPFKIAKKFINFFGI